MQEILNLKEVWEWKYLVNRLLNNREISTEQDKDWRILRKYIKELRTYFEIMSYELKIDENYGFAYLEEMEDMEVESLSKKQKMSFGVTLFLVILREFLYKKETQDLYLNSSIITMWEIKDALWVFLKEKYDNDEKRVMTEIKLIVNKTKALWIISELWDNRFKINKIIKAKMSVDNMEEILDKLKENLT